NAELLRTIVDNFPGSVAAFDKDHNLLLCNERQLDVISCSSETIGDFPQNAEDFYRAEARRNECAAAAIEAYVRNQIAAATGPVAQSIECRHSDGSVTATRTIPLPRGGFVSIVTDASSCRQSLAVPSQPSRDDDQIEPLERSTSLTGVQENTAFFGPPSDGQHDQRMQMETEMREALANNAFELHYQPIVNIKTRKIVGCEALIRWRHPERGLIPASEFIPVAEECGIIGQIGDWVLKTACAEASRWPDDIWIAVNISAAQFSGGNLVDKILALSKRLPASRLVLEITETLLMTDRESAAATLERLKKLGVRFAIDDFGTGFSSLSYLQSFPFDKIKIDRSFVSNTANQKRSATLRRSIIQLGYNLGMTSVAEGVETTQQLDLLRAEGCIEAQGFLFSPAVPSEKIRELFSQPL
ncbi:MAG: EAL domain-containing protein, partial [Hyphomicrobium denitrificans]|nr:EAL domain-containing protein [Hyphomicrobium denitrificans]